MNYDKYKGKKIKKAAFSDDSLYLTFTDDVKIRIYDNGQSCCENRYMLCQDDLSVLEGTILRSIETTSEEEAESEECHDVEFLEIRTNTNVISFSTHNEHNGYYGGFSVQIEEIK
jgi:hypothetical protein